LYCILPLLLPLHTSCLVSLSSALTEVSVFDNFIPSLFALVLTLQVFLRSVFLQQFSVWRPSTFLPTILLFLSLFPALPCSFLYLCFSVPWTLTLVFWVRLRICETIFLWFAPANFFFFFFFVLPFLLAFSVTLSFPVLPFLVTFRLVFHSASFLFFILTFFRLYFFPFPGSPTCLSLCPPRFSPLTFPSEALFFANNLCFSFSTCYPSHVCLIFLISFSPSCSLSRISPYWPTPNIFLALLIVAFFPSHLSPFFLFLFFFDHLCFSLPPLIC